MHKSIASSMILLLATGLAAPAGALRSTSLLPTQQRVQAIGKEVTLGLFPTGIAVSRDGRLALVTNSGFLFQSLTAVDLQTLKAADVPVNPPGANVVFYGVALSADGKTGYASGHGGGADDPVIHVLALDTGPTLTVGTPIDLPDDVFPAGLALSRDDKRLYVALNIGDGLGVVDLAQRQLVKTIPVGRLPWAVALHPSLPQAYVSNRADDSVSIVDTEQQTVIGLVHTGKGPNGIAVSPDGAKIAVANAGSDDVTIFDVNQPSSARRISLSPFDGARPGSSPNAVAFSPDGTRLYVANAWDNAVAVLDAQTETLVGLIPTGFYPSAVALSPDNGKLYITNMKGPKTFPRTRRAQLFDYNVNRRLGGTYGVRGSLQVLSPPSDRTLGLLAKRVRFNNGFDTGIRPSNGPAPNGPCYPIPCTANDVSPIKHVFFIVRENKTYDQLLGDVALGDGEPSFVLYGRQVTPNLHKLVDQWVLMDRFFADSEKSEPGHQWTTASIDSDYVEKTWPATTTNGRPDDIGVHAEQGSVTPVAQPTGLYWFDNCHEHGVSFRIFGEFVRSDESGQPVDYWVQNTNAEYPRFDLSIPDATRFEIWKRDFDQQIAAGSVPQFSYITIPNDHTRGTGPGVPDPRSFVADNDSATGKVIETISNSSVWPRSVIFVVEDDPQSGVDHVDSHRTVGAVIGPYVRRHYVTHTRFDMASMHRTMELILGLPPMSIFDQMAIPMRELFTETPDNTPYSAEATGFPYKLIRADEGAAESAKLDWRSPDRVPDDLLNRLLWDYLKGARRQSH